MLVMQDDHGYLFVMLASQRWRRRMCFSNHGEDVDRGTHSIQSPSPIHEHGITARYISRMQGVYVMAPAVLLFRFLQQNNVDGIAAALLPRTRGWHARYPIVQV